MRLPSSFALVAVVFVSSSGALAGAPEAAAALKKLEAARSALAEAVKRIEVDPPAPKDLDAAHAAVGVLKDAIDAGAAQEGDNLDYAKAALAARKELRTHREFVDDRRGKVKVHEQRRLIDAALADFKDKAKKVEAKEPGSKDFDDARASARALRKALGEGRPFAGQDQKFAAYLNETEAQLAKQEKGIDERWVLLEADKHRAKVDAARKALTAAMASVGTKDTTDEQFKAADKALSELTRLLEDGKALEPSEKAYRAVADQGRAEVTQAKKKMDTAWSETGLAKLKAEIEPAYKDLQAAGKAVKAKKPAPEQLAEAKTAAIVVRKLLEKFEPEAKRSQAFGQYVKEVKGTLVEVEVQLQLRALDAAVADAKQALRPLERRVPTDEQFEVAASALLVLEKTLETVHAKDKAMAPAANDARKLLRDARAAHGKKRVEVDVAVQQDKVDKARAAPTKLLGQGTLTAEALDEAETGLKVLAGALAEGDALTKKDRGYAAFDRETKKRITELQAKLAKGRLGLEVSAAREKLKVAAGLAKEKIDATKLPAATDADLDAAQKAMEGIDKVLEANAPLEAKDSGLQLQSEKLRYETGPRLLENLEAARQMRDLRKKTGDALTAGEKAVAAAEATQNLRAQRTNYEKALAEFTACKDETRRVQATPQLEKTVVLVDGRPSTAKEVVATCAERAEAMKAAIKPITGLIDFEEGPKKSFEAAKQLLSRGKKADAAAQFEECTASALILQHRNPTMKDQSFQVAGSSMTLSELIKQCTSEAKAHRGK